MFTTSQAQKSLITVLWHDFVSILKLLLKLASLCGLISFDLKYLFATEFI